VSFDLREQDPKGARFDAIAQSVLFGLVGCIVGFVAAGLLVGVGNPAGWLIIVGGTSAGAAPLIQWARDRRNLEHLDLFDIDQPLRPLLLRAAAAADRIERAASTAPNGPVRELLEENHHSARAHVKLMEHDARGAGVAHHQEMLRICHQLDELAATSERLLETTLRSQPTVLNALTERTALVTDALAAEAPDAEIAAASSEASEEVGRADRAAPSLH